MERQWVNQQVGDGWMRAWVAWSDIANADNTFDVTEVRYENTSTNRPFDYTITYRTKQGQARTIANTVDPNTPVTTRAIPAGTALMAESTRYPGVIVPQNWDLSTGT